MKSKTGKVFSIVIALSILLSIFCFASTQVNASMPEDYDKLGAGPAKIATLKMPIRKKAVSLIQAVYDANYQASEFEVAPGVVLYWKGDDKITATGEVISQTENKIVFRTDFIDKATGDDMNEKVPGYMVITVNGFQGGTAYSVGEDGVWHKITTQFSYGPGSTVYVRDESGLFVNVRSGYEIVIVK